jgi:hypothetical protein
MNKSTTYPEIYGPQCKGNMRVPLIYNIFRNNKVIFQCMSTKFQGQVTENLTTI